MSLRSLSKTCLLLIVVAILFPAGCRKAAPPSFSPSEEVLQLTEDPDDADTVKVYEQLQAEIAKVLREYSGTPDKMQMVQPRVVGEKDVDSGHIDNTELKHGYAIYSRYCLQCHGVNGDGDGPMARYLDPKPRNYTYGIFKFTSTPYGKKPRRSDLVRTVRRGVTGTSMPSFDRFSIEELSAVVEYVIALALRGELQRELAMIAFDDEELPDDEGLAEVIDDIVGPWHESSNLLVMPVTFMPPMTEESVATGHQLFLKHACNKCHGKFGRGGSMGSVEVGEDAWGYTTAAADLSSGMFHGGGRPIDIYRRIFSGINGTPMPAFEQTFQENPNEIWQLVQFIKATGERRRLGKPPLGEGIADFGMKDMNKN